MVKLFDLCYSEYAWDSLSKWFIKQFYFTKTIVTMQKSNGKSVAFLDIRTIVPDSFLCIKLYSVIVYTIL
ncbi:hypothetical protein RLL53_05805 [Streptococcus pneumoniae]|nr:hypothetical protein [Streptococcus pneumoniae]MDS2497409.1 hypothetical protein [Streptococcus pneumoniae]MDS3141689.1 hypothetical protein [Streptococcus pneumoniae]MDS4795679.1 hypothetical protein [Streptococcus pneumoniae]MDS5043151.1 hypothetical protein [Streptococcus pneumoniae]MDS5125151.1 hypothetical protein [Streptococcus pneumoniae]